MTEEELAEEYLIKRLRIDIDEFEKWKENNGGEVKFAIDCYIAGTKLREKRITDLEWQLKEVLKDNDYYQAENERLEKEKCELLGIIQGKDKAIAELKEQIEKMGLI